MRKQKKGNTHTEFPVVGIGASAGGLDAFKKLLKAIPEDSGMAYVLVQHLSPGHESLLPEILQKVTKIPVMEISDDLKIEPDHIYVIPRNKMLEASDGVLQLKPRATNGEPKRNLIIDLFFISLAEVHQSRAIGVVLSGTASDGTLGLKAIKDYGGVTFAQDADSAAYDGMPVSAIDAGVVDFILPPQKIPQKIQEIVRKLKVTDGELENLPLKEEEIFKHIVSLLRIRKGTDFTYYKQTTIRRRIFRRMALNKIDDLNDYLKRLREDRNEVDNLYQDLLIPVTGFFRDPKSFQRLGEAIIPSIIKNKSSGDPIRMWVAGCSTGEEVYSIAICLKEQLDDLPAKVQIFATDINEAAIAKARAGIYAKRETEGLSPERLKEFFTKTDSNYQVNKNIRDWCVFAVQNFLKDPPFGKVDLISCRNVLIYMEPYLQKKAFSIFHYALNPKGILMLGKSETVLASNDLFNSTDKGDKFFIRKDVPGKYIQVATSRSEENYSAVPHGKTVTVDYQKTADEIVLNKYTPAGVVVNDAMDIVHFRGNTADYLENRSGKPSHNLLKLAKSGLSFELRNLLHKAKKEKAAAIKENIPLKIDGSIRNISVEAFPLPDTVEPYYLILFHDKWNDGQPEIKVPGTKSSKIKKSDAEARVQQLENELSQTREDMRSITEDQETTNEELQSANEELLSSSEELQSLNEELETGKEELQSTNEELIVVNQEMAGLMEQLKYEKEYAQSIIETMRDPMLVLDSQLRVKSANNSYYKTFRVHESETEGKYVYELGSHQWDVPKLRNLLEKVLPEKTKFNDFEIRGTFANIGERVMLLNASEIKRHTPEKFILLAMEDITDKWRVETERLAKEELEKAVRERTVELQLANEALAEKNKELVYLNTELQSFAYISSHDLQEPLRKIQTFTTRLLDKEAQNLSENGLEYYRRIQASAKRMQTLIEDLLTFSRVNTAEKKYKDVELKDVVDEIKKDFKEELEEKGATIELLNSCQVKVIQFQLRQLIQNLISNALKFQKKDNKPYITIDCKIENSNAIKLKKLVPGKDYCHITVKDNGIGFEPQFSEKVFKLFQRLHGNDEYKGTGIGLSIVKKIAENHNGAVTAESQLGKGARFDIYLPVE
jgi:two-component system CheB/CheR fusion protein